MNCRICLSSVDDDQKHSNYHDKCIAKLFGSTSIDPKLEFSRLSFFQAAPKKTKGMSISGVQNKAQLHIENRKLEITDFDGTHILKPTPEEFPFCSENEHVSMEIVRTFGIPTPPCGLIPFQKSENKEVEYAYVIKRFDRDKDHNPIHQEDMMQVMGFSNESTDSKYESASYYDVLVKLKEIGGSPLQLQFFKSLVISYLICNEDHHLKNISILHTNPVRLTPAYDFLNTMIITKSGTSMALNFYKDKLPKYFEQMCNGYFSKQDFLDLASDSGLSIAAAKLSIKKLISKQDEVLKLIKSSFLPDDKKDEYTKTFKQRIAFMI